MLLADLSEAALWAIPLASTVIALAALIYTAIGVRSSADAKHVAHLEDELDRANKRIEFCEEDRANLRNEVERMGRREVELMRMVVDLQRDSRR